MQQSQKKQSQKSSLSQIIKQIKPLWQKLLYDKQISIKIQNYRKWPKNLQFEGKNLLQKDISRTRNQQIYMKDQKFKMLLRHIVTFYCINNHINYQQGILQIAIPFALLKNKSSEKNSSLYFSQKDCYGYFDSFMNRLPKVLSQKVLSNKKQLPLTAVSLHLLTILLNYLYPQVYYQIKKWEIPLSMIFTQQIMTVFAIYLDIQLVFQVFTHFIQSKNQNHLLLMAIALVGLRENQIRLIQEQQIHSFLNRKLKNFINQQSLNQWFQLCLKIYAKVPKQFIQLSKNIGFSNPNNEQKIYSVENYEQMLKKDKQFLSFLLNFQFNQQNCSKKSLILISDKKLILKSSNSYDIKTICICQFPSDQQICSQINKSNNQINKSNKHNKMVVLVSSEFCYLNIEAKDIQQKKKINYIQKLIQMLQLKINCQVRKINQKQTSQFFILQKQTKCTIY